MNFGNFNLDTIIRENILNLKPYSSARDEFKGNANVWLDANENPNSSNVNRYPDPYQSKLKAEIGNLKKVLASHIFLGNGSDEPIDLLIRACCEPQQDKICILPPTYGMYEVAANINHVEIVKIPLKNDFSLNTEIILNTIKNQSIKLLFICSPNNPTGNIFPKKEITKIIESFHGIVVIDEAYQDFSSESGFLSELTNYPNLVVLQTFSKAWGMAGIRLGMAFASTEIVAILNKIKPPYNINILTQEFALQALKKKDKVENEIQQIILERNRLTAALKQLESVNTVFPSEANFILVKINHANKLYHYLTQKGIVIRDRSSIIQNCIRITIGTTEENKLLLQEITNFYTK